MPFLRMHINVGTEEYVLPSIEGCLNDISGKFRSAPNALRIHEWLGGTSVDLPVITAVTPEKNGTVMDRTMGLPTNGFATDVYGQATTTQWLLEAEQICIARHVMHETMQSNLAVAEEASMYNQLQDSTQKVFQVMAQLALFNANCMFLNTPFPKRMVYESLMTLDMLCLMVRTNRDLVVYERESDSRVDWPLELYRQEDLATVVSLIHQATQNNNFQDPERYVKQAGLLDANFFLQCAMAYSSEAGVKIPRAYIAPNILTVKEDTVFHWARKVLRAKVDYIDSLRIAPKKQNVVQLFR